MVSKLRVNQVESLDGKGEGLFSYPYEANLVIDSHNTVLREGDQEYKLSESVTLPYTTTGAGMPEGGAFVTVGDAALRQELSAGVAIGQGALLVRGSVIYVDTIADLLALPVGGLVDGQQVQVKEYHAGTGVGGGLLYFDQGDTTTADNGGTVFVDGDGVRWKRQIANHVDVTQFGAVGDGSNDDTQAINDAIVAGAGGVVLIPEGTYLVTNTIRLQDGTTLRGVGADSIITIPNSAATGFDFFTILTDHARGDEMKAIIAGKGHDNENRTVDVVIESLTVNANGDNQGDEDWAGIAVDCAERWTVRNCSVIENVIPTNARVFGILTTRCNWVTVHNNRIDKGCYDQIGISQGASDLIISENICTNHGGITTGASIQIAPRASAFVADGCRRITITGNHCKDYHHSGIVTHAKDGSLATDYNGGQDSSIREVTIDGNIVTSEGSNGEAIQVMDRGENVSVTNNKIVVISTNDRTSGIRVRSSGRGNPGLCTISNNNIRVQTDVFSVADRKGFAILLENGVNETVVSGNVCVVGVTSGAVTTQVIRLGLDGGNVLQILVANNRISGFGGAGGTPNLHIGESTNRIFVQGNQVRGAIVNNGPLSNKIGENYTSADE